MEHQPGVDARRDAVPCELRVEQRHVVRERVVAAQQWRHARVGCHLARQVAREAGTHLGEGGRARDGAAVEAVHAARLLGDGHPW